VATQIHNHRFGFTSYVLVGRTFDVRYHVLPIVAPTSKPAFRVYEAVPRFQEDTRLEPTKEMVVAEVSHVEFLEAGDVYTFPPLEYHEHVPTRETVATFMQKGFSVPDYNPRILVPVGVEPDNDYNRYQRPVEELWEVVDSVCRAVRNWGLIVP